MDILTVQQAAAFLQISDDVLYPLIKSGEIPAGKVRGQWRMIKEDLAAWLRAQYATKPNQSYITSCHTVEQEQITGGSLSKEYDRLLGLTPKKTRKPSKPN